MGWAGKWRKKGRPHDKRLEVDFFHCATTKKSGTNRKLKCFVGFELLAYSNRLKLPAQMNVSCLDFSRTVEHSVAPAIARERRGRAKSLGLETYFTMMTPRALIKGAREIDEMLQHAKVELTADEYDECNACYWYARDAESELYRRRPLLDPNNRLWVISEN